MIVVNFLPYWEEVQKKKTIVFWSLISVIILAGLLINAAIFSVVSSMNSIHLERNNFLEKNLSELQKISVDYERVSAGIKFIEGEKKIIESMHLMRKSIIDFLRELSKIVPEGLYLTDIRFQTPMDKSQKAGVDLDEDGFLLDDLFTPYWELSGFSQNSQIISDFIRAIEGSYFFSLYKVGEIQFLPVSAHVSSRERFSIIIKIRDPVVDNSIDYHKDK